MSRFISTTIAFGGIVCFLFTTSSCVKEYDMKKLAKIDYTPNLAAPLIKSSMTINDLLKYENNNGNIQIGADKLLTIVYRGRLLSLKAEDFIAFPNQSYPFSTPPLSVSDLAAFNALPVNSTYTVPFPSQTITYNTNGAANIDSIVFKTPTAFDISIRSQFRHNTTVRMDIPYAKKNGVPFSQTVTLLYTGTVPTTGIRNIDLNGYVFDMTMGGTTQNKFVVNMSVILTKSSNALLPTDNVTIDLGFSNPKFQKLFGYLQQPLLSPNVDTVGLSIFQNAAPGGGIFTIVNPAVRIYLTNSYGVPIDATFIKLEGYNPGFSPYTISVTNEPKLNPWHFPYPSTAQLGSSVKDSVILTNTNTGGSSTVPGSIGYVLNNKPKNIIYQVRAQANPNGIPIPPNTNFALDTSHLTIDFQIDLPLYGTAKNFSIADTADFSFNQNDINSIESFLFRLNVTNGFPIDMGVQVYFTDSISPTQQYHVLDSLISPYQVLLPAAGVDGDGKVNSPSSKTTDITFNQTRINKVKSATDLIIRGKFSTTNDGNANVKIYSDYKFDVRLGVMVKIKTKL